MTPYFATEGVTLYHADALALMATLGDGSVDAVICDPPYGTTACAWDTVIPFAPMWEQLKRIVKPRGAIVLFGSQPFTSALVMSNPTMFKYETIWKKSNVTGFLSAKTAPLKQHENILVFGDGAVNYYPQFHKKHREIVRGAQTSAHTVGVYGLHVEGNFREIAVSEGFPRSIVVFNTPYHDREAGLHPTQKPVALMQYLISTYTNAGDTVLDFAAGSFTTGVACVNLGRRFIGVERERTYVDIGVRRIAAALAQPRLIADAPRETAEQASMM